MTDISRLRDIVEGNLEYPVKAKKFWVPELDTVAPFVKKELEENFKNVSVSKGTFLKKFPNSETPLPHFEEKN